MIFRAVLICVLQLVLSFTAESGYAQARKPTANEITAIRNCAAKNADTDQGERRCLFNLVAQPCIDKRSSNIMTEVGCYETETSIWDGLLNDNYKSLLDTLDSDQTAKAQAMQRLDRLSRHYVLVLRRQDPGHDVAHYARGLRDTRNGAAGDAA
jgi:hypothetical protein